MPTVMSLFGTLWPAWRPAKVQHEPRVTEREQLDDIRRAMLEALRHVQGAGADSVARRIRASQDIQQLWFLRPALMAALASAEGEARARERLHRISQLFGGTMPGGPQLRQA